MVLEFSLFQLLNKNELCQIKSNNPRQIYLYLNLLCHGGWEWTLERTQWAVQAQVAQEKRGTERFGPTRDRAYDREAHRLASFNL